MIPSEPNLLLFYCSHNSALILFLFFPMAYTSKYGRVILTPGAVFISFKLKMSWVDFDRVQPDCVTSLFTFWSSFSQAAVFGLQAKCIPEGWV